MSTRFTNISGDGVVLFAPTGHPDAMQVAADGEVEVPGDITSELDDAYIVGEGDDARAWPKATWALGGAPKSEE